MLEIVGSDIDVIWGVEVTKRDKCTSNIFFFSFNFFANELKRIKQK